MVGRSLEGTTARRLSRAGRSPRASWMARRECRPVCRPSCTRRRFGSSTPIARSADRSAIPTARKSSLREGPSRLRESRAVPGSVPGGRESSTCSNRSSRDRSFNPITTTTLTSANTLLAMMMMMMMMGSCLAVPLGDGSRTRCRGNSTRRCPPRPCPNPSRTPDHRGLTTFVEVGRPAPLSSARLVPSLDSDGDSAARRSGWS